MRRLIWTIYSNIRKSFVPTSIKLLTRYSSNAHKQKQKTHSNTTAGVREQRKRSRGIRNYLNQMTLKTKEFNTLSRPLINWCLHCTVTQLIWYIAKFCRLGGLLLRKIESRKVLKINRQYYDEWFKCVERVKDLSDPTSKSWPLLQNGPFYITIYSAQT